MSQAECFAYIPIIQEQIPGIVKAYPVNKPPAIIGDVKGVFANKFSTFDWAQISYGQQRRQHTFSVAMNLVIANRWIPDAENDALEFIPLVIAKFEANAILGGRCSSAQITQYKPGMIEWGGITFFGLQFILQVKLIEPVDILGG